MRSVPVIVILLALTLAILAPVAGAAPTITQQGTDEHPFAFETLPATLELYDAPGEAQNLRLAVAAIERIDGDSAVYDGAIPDPRSIQVLGNGHLLFADRTYPMAAEVTRSGDLVWAYTIADDPTLVQIFSAQRFTRNGQELTLIVDRRQYRVWAVDEQKRIVWQYGVAGENGLTVNHLADPFYASYSEAADTVMITDCNGGNRVLEVRYGDYLSGAPDNGFTEQSIVWSYGEAGVAGAGPGQLDKPHCAERLADGNVLITDADASRVTEVDRSSKEIVWHYGVTYEPGVEAGRLSDPNHAIRLQDGDTLITDTGGGRVLRVGHDGQIDEVYDVRTMGRPPGQGTGEPEPRAAAYTQDGLLAVAESAFQQIVLLGHESSAQAVSTPLDCGKPGVTKAFVSLTWQGDTGQPGTRIALDYRLDGGSWRKCAFRAGLRRYDFPAGTIGKTIAYRVTLGSDDRRLTPDLDSVVIQSTVAKTGVSGGGGGGSEGGSGNSGQSGVYTYPSTAEGGTGTSGTGTGSGSSGTGSGSGSSGTGTGSSGAGGGSSTVTNSVDVPVQSTGSGETQAVQGYEVQGEEGVSGVPLRAEEGPQAPEPERPGPAVPVLALVATALVVAAAFFVPWPIVAAHMRRITGFDHTRPARSLPFRPLGK